MNRRAQQKENARLIGFGHESWMDADEPGFSQNLEYLVGAGVEMLQGDHEKAPCALSMIERASRVLAMLMRLLAWFWPVGRTRSFKTFWPLLLALVVILAAVYGVGFAAGRNYEWSQIAGWAITAAIVAVSLLALIALGCLLGWRWGPAAASLLFVGIILGFLFANKPMSFDLLRQNWLFMSANGAAIVACIGIAATSGKGRKP